MRKDDHLIFEALNSNIFTVVSVSDDRSSEYGFDTNCPVEHIQARDLKDAVNKVIKSLRAEGAEDFEATYPKEFREFKKDYFMMSSEDGAGSYYVFPGKFDDNQAIKKLMSINKSSSEDA